MARREINYEVHVLQSGRWEIQSRYPEKKEKSAVEEAVVMGRMKGIAGVRVIKEAYDPEEGTSNDTVIYQHPRRKTDQSGSEDKQNRSPSESWDVPSSWDTPSSKGKKRKKSTRTETWDDDDDDDDDDVNRKSRKKSKSARKKKKATEQKSSLVGVIVKFLLIILFSVLIGAVCATIASMLIRDTSMSTNAQTNIMFITFVIVFLSSAGYMGYSVLSKTTIKTSSRRTMAAAPAPVTTSTTARKTHDDDKKSEKINRDAYSDNEAFDSFLPTPDLGNVADSEDDDEADVEEEKEKKEEVEEEIKEEKIKEEEETLPKKAEDQKLVMMKFLSDGLAKVQSSQNKLDSFNKFGINLFMAGGCEVLGKDHDLSPKSVVAILSEGVKVMGFKKEDATSFAGKYEDYLLADSRYMQIFQAGRNAMNTYINDPSTSAESMEKALAEWNKPKEREEKTGPVTVMFTDMVGSTALTQSKGDAVAQKVVHAHNRIVRDALNKFAGKEIKHTGDGIMASFSTTSNSIEASIAIQNDVEAHNLKKPDLPLHLKIGINAGEPISEDDDLFGTTVQLSARIVDKAQSEQIFVSEIVRGICAGKDMGFINRGQYEMKGFAEPVTLYEVIWKKESSDS